MRRHRLSALFPLALTSLLVVALPALAAGDAPRVHSEKIRIVPKPVDVDIWTDQARYCVGEEIEIFFRSDADAYVAVFDTDTRGRTHRIFPNRFDREHFVRGGEVYRLPERGYRFEVEGPPGIETLSVLAAPTRRELRDAVDAFLDDRAYRPARSEDRYHRRSARSHARERVESRAGAPYVSAPQKIVVVPERVAYASTEHRVIGPRACGHSGHRPAYRPWWRR